MPTEVPRILLRLRYEEAAQQYLRNLPLEHFMEATSQSKQREITLNACELIQPTRSDFHYFNELLVQYEQKDEDKPGQVVPDNMIVLHDGPIKAEGSYNLPVQPARPFMMLEYVSNSNRRKDYDDNMVKYEKHLKVPYYLLFEPNAQELSLYRHTGRKYVSVKPNGNGRYAIPELELEVAIRDGWVRYWYRGELLPLPADLLRQRDEEKRRADGEKRRADAEKRRADDHQRQTEEERRARQAVEAELARLKAEVERLRGRS